MNIRAPYATGSETEAYSGHAGTARNVLPSHPTPEAHMIYLN